MVRHAHVTGRAAVRSHFIHTRLCFCAGGGHPSISPPRKGRAARRIGRGGGGDHPFNADVANIRAAEFVSRLVQHARMTELWCGSDFALGHNREGTVEFLRAEGEQRGFTVTLASPELADGEVISSTRIRQALRDGAVEQAARYLGRPFRLTGEVVEGAHRGRTIGIPTANLAVSEEHAIPATGVYACRAYPGGTQPVAAHRAVTNIGYRPTFESQAPTLTVEAHLLDFSDIYGRRCRLNLSPCD
jgi:riboflavin kinase/FMN adenylyltransferase